MTEEGEMAALKVAKKDLRTLMRTKLAEVSAGSIAEQSVVVAKSLQSMVRYAAAKRIGIYLSMTEGEIMTTAIVKKALSEGKQVFVPYIYALPQDSGNPKAGKVMDMVALHSKKDFDQAESQRDSWGIPTVSDESVVGRKAILKENGTDSSKIDLDMIVMPGMAFDRKGKRLGHGKGFYDTFLKSYHDRYIRTADPGKAASHQQTMPLLVGLALNEQIMFDDQEVPTGPSDWRLDAVVTGGGLIMERSSIDGHACMS